jgi:hypothetical protein
MMPSQIPIGICVCPSRPWPAMACRGQSIAKSHLESGFWCSGVSAPSRPGRRQKVAGGCSEETSSHILPAASLWPGCVWDNDHWAALIPQLSVSLPSPWRPFGGHGSQVLPTWVLYTLHWLLCTFTNSPVIKLSRFQMFRAVTLMILKGQRCHVWLCTTVIPTLRRLRQAHHEFETGLGYIARPCLKKQTKRTKSIWGTYSQQKSVPYIRTTPWEVDKELS